MVKPFHKAEVQIFGTRFGNCDFIIFILLDFKKTEPLQILNFR
ncbi:hypothetical protein LX77_01251 [Gelidibacter algens]|uniref:Uncharacterized protein n=1 Tax=Gelidibacter algens TaxID=49280 RepID=A0A327SB14_9FLAO|nr:hypothetical protein LX77_01251 [Gelidibacter algens]